VPTFYVDPWHGVDTAVITHAHADHARYTDKPVYLHGVAGKGPYGVDDGDGTLLSAVQWRWLEELPTRAGRTTNRGVEHPGARVASRIRELGELPARA
jgi:hypothetical protein